MPEDDRSRQFRRAEGQSWTLNCRSVLLVSACASSWIVVSAVTHNVNIRLCVVLVVTY